ncbi:MAG: hypothetical protein VB855_05210 [Pirellulaceae bacterium]
MFVDLNRHEEQAPRPRSRRVLVLLLAALAIAWFAPGNRVIGDEDERRLRQRITELEAENRALRKIITGIQGALKSVPKTRIPQEGDAGGLRVVILPGDWGSSELEDIRRVCVSSAGALWSQLSEDGLAPILVRRSQTGPISLYKRGEGNEYVVELDTSNNAWAQCAFQFSHEFCHILCNYRNVPNRQLWFEETLCECASLFALRQMAEEWKTKAPYSNWTSYAPALGDYAADRIKKFDAQKDPVSKFYQTHRATLEESANNRELNGYIAVKLLPLFEKTPSAWQALRYLNLGPKKENMSFKNYLSGWHDRVPKEHKQFVKKVAEEFGIDLAP